MRLDFQQVRQSDASFNESRNIAKSSFERNVKSAVENINSPNRFELLNCETTEKEENNQSYDKDTSIVYSNTVNPYCKYEQSKRPEEVAKRFP